MPPWFCSGTAAVCRVCVAGRRSDRYDLIKSYEVLYQLYANDTQLYLSMRAEDAAQGLDTLSSCSLAARDWYLVNHVQCGSQT